jgi:hypothetical protein
MTTTVQPAKLRYNEAIVAGFNRQTADGLPRKLSEQLKAVHADLLRLEREFESHLAECALHKKSVRNLIHYLALRRHDIRQLQEELAALGLSWLGRTESHVLAGIEAVLKLLRQLAGCEWVSPDGAEPGLEFAEGKTLLCANTDALLGPPPRKRNVPIMVTVPREAAQDYQLIGNYSLTAWIACGSTVRTMTTKRGLAWSQTCNGHHDGETRWRQIGRGQRHQLSLE